MEEEAHLFQLILEEVSDPGKVNNSILPSKHEALSSNPQTTKKQTNKQKNRPFNKVCWDNWQYSWKKSYFI
jgi:hypothetical protein